MMFELDRFGNTALPIIWIQLLESEAPRSALIDTGASRCILPYKVGVEIGLHPRKEFGFRNAECGMKHFFS